MSADVDKAWQRYERAYMAAQSGNDDAINEQIESFEAVVALIGEKAAIKRFWAYMRTLPIEHQSDIDPHDSDY